MEKYKQQIRQWGDAVTRFVWHSRRDERSALQWLLIRMVRTVVLAVQGFSRHQGALYVVWSRTVFNAELP